MTEKVKKTLSSLQNLCSRREYCSSDILEKAMKGVDGDSAEAAEILSSLIADHYVDDARYASAFAREKASLSGWGPVKIRYALRMKKMEGALIDAALSGIDAEKAEEKLEKVLLTKWKTLSGDPQAKYKLIRFALSRGYEYDSVRDLTERISRENRAD